jgi:hypothetical protein
MSPLLLLRLSNAETRLLVRPSWHERWNLLAPFELIADGMGSLRMLDFDAQQLRAQTERLLSECDALIAETARQVEALQTHSSRNVAAMDKFARKVPEARTL